MLFVAGCGTSQKVSSQTDTLPKNPQTEIEQIAADTLSEKEDRKHRRDDEPVIIDTLDIALILPFYLDSVKEIPDTAEVSYYPQSGLAIEFYNGVKIALDSLAKSGLRARVHVYDDANDRERVKKIASLPDFKNMDLLLGPIYNNNLRLMAEFAKRDSIYLVSPLSPAVYLTSGNPYYIMVNPSIEVHCKKIFDYVIQRHFRDNILLFTRPDTVTSDYASIFQDYLRKYQAETGTLSPTFSEVNYVPQEGETSSMIDEELEAYLHETRKNILIIPSVDRAYIHSVSRSLNPLIDPPKEMKDAKRYDITVMGLPAWGDQEGLRLDYVQKLKVHFTSSYYVDSSFYRPQNHFYKSYVAAFQAEPSEYVVKGFDLMKFFGNLMSKYGSGFDTLLLSERASGIHTDFNFGIHPAPNGASVSIDSIPTLPATDFIENKYVHLLKYEGYSVKKVE